MKPIHPKGLALALAAAVLLIPLLSLQAGTTAADKININTASSAELDKLPRVGPKVAQRIIDYRKEFGPFKRIEDLMKVKGIGEKTFAKLKDMVTIGPEATPTK